MGLFFKSLLFPTPLHDSGSKSTKAPGRELFLLTNEVQLKGIILIVFRQQLQLSGGVHARDQEIEGLNPGGCSALISSLSFSFLYLLVVCP